MAPQGSRWPLGLKRECNDKAEGLSFQGLRFYVACSTCPAKKNRDGCTERALGRGQQRLMPRKASELQLVAAGWRVPLVRE